ncbi:MAG: phosphomannose isomerase type II C-terminal cupin domain [Candidatus Paceibacterota bacterium]|jgi:mannose-1-phosphate guanylyltransferase/mannose-6-phosphate isomerase
MEQGYPFDSIRPWGNFRQFTKNTPVTVKIISVKPDEILSLQSHTKRSEFWRVISGSGFVEIDGVRKDVKTDDEIEVPLGAKHRMGSGSIGMQILEIAFGEFDEEDIIRYEDKYGRA